MTDAIVTRPTGGQIARHEFGAQQTQALAETSAAAVAAQARAAIESRYVMAMRNPRDMDSVRVKLLKECKRPSFAEVARYRKPIGKGVEGLSIRFVEAAFRCMGNVLAESSVVFEDDHKRIVRVMVTDLETNVTYPRDVVVDKTVERSQIKEGQTLLGQRINSNGNRVFIVQATDDELLNKQASLESKAIRALGLRLVPGDLQDECEAAVIATKQAAVKADPDAERRKLIDAFASLSVQPRHLVEYLGHDLDLTSPAELLELRNVWVALRDGEATWHDTVAARRAERGETPDERGQAADDRPTRGVAGVKVKLSRRVPGGVTAAPPASLTPPGTPSALERERAYRDEPPREEPTGDGPPMFELTSEGEP